MNPLAACTFVVSRRSRMRTGMHNEFTAIIERADDWFIAYSPEIPGANGQGRTSDEARANLAEAIALILEDRREDALRGVPDSALRETVVVE
jgi:predicted RNase H-like HicB family nuclease